ncbi:glutamate racemase [Taibaiella lutea]|uniref:Glutamate racemase n=1 Tax=Taibaiella lutea TaxID=2608001 RepID=A0A5M6CF20_9BACT|nr:glutamate racemase [Taibaiella lutea]KAA5533583.1 glutamate racemase [Taibaiella lutea]
MQPIGIFDSGYGGLTVFRSIADKMPQYDYIYLGDNARAPYGNRSFETVYEYTLECVEWFFEQGCPLVIVACNTASAKALRSIQQNDLPDLNPENRVLGVIRPSAEIIGEYTQTKKVGILATKGTVTSESYLKEIANFYPDIQVFQHACPLWVPFVESGDYKSDAVDKIIQQDIEQLFKQDANIDTVLLACTHYPLLKDKIEKYLPGNVKLISQGPIVANSLVDYLQRHSTLDNRITKTGFKAFYTTDDVKDFEEHATTFFGEAVKAQHVHLEL